MVDVWEENYLWALLHRRTAEFTYHIMRSDSVLPRPYLVCGLGIRLKSVSAGLMAAPPSKNLMA